MFNIEGSRFSKAFKIHSFRFIRSNYVDYTTFLYGRNIDSSKLHFFYYSLLQKNTILRIRVIPH